MDPEYNQVYQELYEENFNQLDKNHDGVVTPTLIIIA